MRSDETSSDTAPGRRTAHGGRAAAGGWARRRGDMTLTRALAAAAYGCWRPLVRRRLGRMVLERIDGVPLLVLPEVFNPPVFPTRVWLARGPRRGRRAPRRRAAGGRGAGRPGAAAAVARRRRRRGAPRPCPARAGPQAAGEPRPCQRGDHHLRGVAERRGTPGASRGRRTA